MILSIDTSGSFAAVATSRKNKDALGLIEECRGDTNGVIMPMIQKILAEARRSIAQIDVIGCVVGPGSYTGTRIGISTVKGLSDALGGIPCVPISSLEAAAWAKCTSSAYRVGTVIAPIIDARGGNVYTALFRVTERLAPNQLTPVRLAPDAIMPRRDIPPEAEVFEVGATVCGEHELRAAFNALIALPMRDFAANPDRGRWSSDALSPVYLKEFETNKRN